MAHQATPGTFFDAALRILAGSGRNGLRIGHLCRAVGVTSGSFYHHFGSWEGFVSALLEHWEQEQTSRIVALVSSDDDPLHRIRLLKELAVDLPHDAETAIRGWAGTDAAVAAAQRRVDERRRAALRDVLDPVIADPDLRALLAEMGMSVLVGYQQSLADGGGADLAAMLDQFELLVRGHVNGVLGDGTPTTRAGAVGTR